MEPWLFGFVTGILFGRADAAWLTPRTLGGVMLLTTIFLGLCLLRFHKIALFAAGWIWGFANAAPPFEGEGEAEVVRSAAVFAAPRPVLVRVEDFVYEATAPPGRAGNGTLRFRPYRDSFAGGRSTLRPATGTVETGLLHVTVAAMRSHFHRTLGGERPFLRDWLLGTLLGERTALPRRVAAAFKATGTYHLIAVSGLHVSLLVAVFSLILRAPFQVAYALRWLSPAVWCHMASGLKILAALLAFLYLALTGMPAAAQRAVLTYMALQIGAVSLGVPPVKTRLQLVAVAQTLCFPIGFVSAGCLMSWAAFLVVVEGAGRRLFWTQLRLTVMAAAAFGQVPLIGLFANLLLVPVFSLLLVLGLAAAAVGPALPGFGLILAMHASFIEIVLQLGRLIERWPWLALAGDDLPAFCQAMLWVLSTLFLLNTCRNLSIDQGVGEDARCRSLGSEKAW